ncbi:SDR family NAD(P)-dependent oxidoreductase [Streptomyces sp. NPDC001591]|uniref:SDR family NAD(P)-dependent oxidoreductase n=1 Tax=Streptomyces sp. NPDC001591 TaxID=3364589 RepID=UPI0036746734
MPIRIPIPGTALAGRTCLVTGAGSGLGRALAFALAGAGAQVWGCDSSTANLATTRRQLAPHPRRDAVTLDQVDVTDRAAVEEWIGRAHTTTARVDVLFNNAAFIRWQDVADMGVEDAERTMRTAYDAMVYGIKAVLPVMRHQGGGHIITVGSSAGRVYVQGPSAAYAASKAALEAYTRILQLELAATPVHVTLVRPGVIAGTQFFSQHVPSTRLPRLADFLPAGSPDQIADTITRALVRPRTTIDTPRYLPLFYAAYALAPKAVQRLAALGGPARRDYAAPVPNDTSDHPDRPQPAQRT